MNGSTPTASASARHLLPIRYVAAALVIGGICPCVGTVAQPEVVGRLTYPRPAALRQYSGDDQAVTDATTGRRFAAGVTVETEQNGETQTRFAVHVPDSTHLPLARKAARFLAVLWGLADSRFGALNARLRSGKADVWICRDGEAGGEQTRTSIYLYDAMADRSDLEWARTIAHEYGHYLLPGPTGYAEPESWANGLLGERLFLGWLRDELREGKLSASDNGFLNLADADMYGTRQVDPLVERVSASGPNVALLALKTRAAMDEAIALILYADKVHGSHALPRMLEWLQPGRGQQAGGGDFLKAYEAWLSGADLIRHRVTVGRAYKAFLPAGTFAVREAERRSLDVTCSGCSVKKDADGVVVRCPTAGWRTVKLDAQGLDRVEALWVRSAPKP
jgi:hypothetical protein